MNTEISLCEGNQCQLRELCKRYVEHTKLNGHEKLQAYYYTPVLVGNLCGMFLRNHEKSK